MQACRHLLFSFEQSNLEEDAILAILLEPLNFSYSPGSVWPVICHICKISFFTCLVWLQYSSVEELCEHVQGDLFYVLEQQGTTIATPMVLGIIKGVDKLW
jgi:hypothetical protein